MQAAQFQPPLNRLPSEAQPNQLAPGNHTMLATRQLGERRLASRQIGGWSLSCTVSVTLRSHPCSVASAA
jgi:hypothetical protein